MAPPTAPAQSPDGVVTVTDVADVTLLAPEWDALADLAGAPPWFRPAWIDAWFTAFGRGRLVLLAARRGDALVGVLPLERIGQELRSTTNYHTPSFGLLGRDAAACEALAAAALDRAGRRLSVAFLPASDPSLTTLASTAKQAGRWTHQRVLERCPYIVLDGDWPAYAAGRRGHLVRELRRRERRLRQRGTLVFEVLDGGTDLERRLDEGLAVEASGWKGAGGTAMRSRDATRTFYASIARALAARGALRLGFLRLDGRPLAFDFAIEEGGVHSLLKTGYDPAFRADGPGVLLRAKAIERAFALGLHRYDFLGRDDPWKRQWTDLVEPQLLFQAFRGGLGVGDWAAQRYLRPVARRVARR